MSLSSEYEFGFKVEKRTRQIRLSDRASRSNHCLVRGCTVSFASHDVKETHTETKYESLSFNISVEFKLRDGT